MRAFTRVPGRVDRLWRAFAPWLTGSIYMAVTFVVSGMADYRITDQESAPISWVFGHVGLHWATYLINVVRMSVCV